MLDHILASPSRVLASLLFVGALTALPVWAKPGADDALQLLKAGNERFAAGKATNPNAGVDRVALAGKSDQADYAYATIVSCSDSRVAVENLVDAGVMDIFVIRVAGNICAGDEIGSIEYGLCHVKTPVLVIMGHTQCGAIKATIDQVLTPGQGHALEANIPGLLKTIRPAIEEVQKAFPQVSADNLITRGTEQNVWQGMTNLFLASSATRALVKEKKVRVVGSIYDTGAGTIRWLPEENVLKVLAEAEKDPKVIIEASTAGEHAGATGHADAPKGGEHAAPPVHAATVHAQVEH